MNSTKLARISLSPTTFTWFLNQFKSVSDWQLLRQQLSEEILSLLVEVCSGGDPAKNLDSDSSAPSGGIREDCGSNW